MIGVVTTSYPRFPGDFAGTFVATRVRQLRAQGFDVEIIAAGRSDADSDLETRIGSPIFDGAGAPEALESDGAWPAALGFSLRLVETVRRRCARWTRIESHWLAPSGLAAALGAPGVPHRAFAHSGDVALLERLPVGLGRLFARFVAARASEVVCVSRDLEARVRALVGDLVTARITTARLAVEADFGPGHAPPSAGNLVLGVGRLVPVKGFDVLIHAVGRLPRMRRPRVRILGDGPERGRLTRLAHACRVDLELPGRVPHAQMPAEFARADLCAVPSRRLANGRSEGMPLVALEAIACGTPLVASAVGGIGELRGQGPYAVRLVPPDDEAALTRVLDAALPPDSRPVHRSDIPCATDG